MQQAHDFIEESDCLANLLKDAVSSDFEKPTLFKNWTVNDILVHLHFWNMAADMALNDPSGFEEMLSNFRSDIANGNLRKFENAQITERGPQLLEIWRVHYRDMGARWAVADPKQRLKWAGPEMSVRSSISARQMEIWAHGQAAFDLFGKTRSESNRIGNIVFLGVNAFAWSHKVQGLAIPETMPKLELTSPSGDVWEFGDVSAGLIFGSAVEFCQVVTQTRNIQDTSLKLDGEIATAWMHNAQCFAGPPETPPAPGYRK